MARKKTSHHRLKLKAVISDRLRDIRQELFGEHGGPELARRLNLPARTWYNYETGVTVPAEILLAFIDQTGTNPVWLLTGEGPKYRRGLEDQVLSDLSPQELIRRGLEKLEQQQGSAALSNLSRGADAGDFVAVGVIEPETLADPSFDPKEAKEFIPIYRKWLPHPHETVAVRLDDEAMHPILPAGSVVAVDRSVREIGRLEGRIVAARVEDNTVFRWLELSGRHLILRPNQTGPNFPTVALEIGAPGTIPEALIGLVVWSWSRFI